MTNNARYGISESSTPNGFVVCDNCGETVPCFSQSGLPEHGLNFSLNRLDYYGGFTDTMFSDNKDLLLCHDCCVVLVSALPAIASLCKTSHPCELDKPCCDFAWTTVDGVTFTASNGEWVESV